MRRIAFIIVVVLGACQREKPIERRFYDSHIQPIFDRSCVGNTSPCHKIDVATSSAAGNLDLSSFAGVQRRRDVLRKYGAYPEPLLLLKAVSEKTGIPYREKFLVAEINHVGGNTLAKGSEAFSALNNWISNGANRDGVAPTATGRMGTGGCNKTLSEDFIPGSVDRGAAAYRAFAADIQPLLTTSCSFATCHGSPQSDLYLTCGDSDDEKDSNFLRASSLIVDAPLDAERSELLLRPLNPLAGGVSHTGGTFFSSRDDATWKKLKAFAVKVQAVPPVAANRTPGETFFGEHVMPVMLKRGCALETCHSPNGFNDFRLRPGSVGFLANLALRRNYDAALGEFMNLDTPDVRQSRLVKKNLFPQNGGIFHRGGNLLEGPGAPSTVPCPVFDDKTPEMSSAFCILKEWHRRERKDRAMDVSPLGSGTRVPIAFIARPPDPDAAVEFDTFRGGAELRLGDGLLADDGRVEKIENVRNALGPCMGLSGRMDLDLRGPEWSPDGLRVIFAARMGDAGGLDLWLLEPAKNACRRLTDDNGRRENGVRVHNFDPVFAPDGSVVFASTRAGTLTLKRQLPNADLYRVGPALDFAATERMTYLNNSELSPAFMQNGQLSFTAEKSSAEFYQLSGRRMNWDLTDYHPLLAQRAESDDTFGKKRPSVGYRQATEIREVLDRNFVLILSDPGHKGSGGALGVFNRSLGPFEEGRTEATFPRSLHLPDPAATGRSGTRGVYRSPYPLPNGEILASFAANVSEPTRDVPRYDLVAVVAGSPDHPGPAPRMMLAGGAQSLVEASVGYKRPSQRLFFNHPQLVFGGHGPKPGESTSDRAIVHFPDLPMLATLLDANLRRGRNLATFDTARRLAVYESLPPTPGTADPAKIKGSEQVYTDRKLLGTAALETDGSLKVSLPARKPLILELQNGDGKAIFTMREEHQVGPGEVITPGIPRKLFNGICGGCHGSQSGNELDVAVTADALTGASVSLSRDGATKGLQ